PPTRWGGGARPRRGGRPAPPRSRRPRPPGSGWARSPGKRAGLSASASSPPASVSSPAGPGRHASVVAAAFFLSGAAALIYQVTWQRLLALHSGVGIYSIAMIVAAFMVGLGLGSHLGGVLSVRLPPRTALLAFATLELAIGFFGLASGRLYYDWLYLRAGGLYATSWRAAILHFVSLALPTILMGMSLPLLVRAMVRDTTHAARTV